MNNLLKLAFGAILSVATISCNNDNNVGLTNKVDAYIQFDPVFGTEAFELNHNFTSANNGVVNISTLKYIISDITLHGTDGTADYTATAQESFHIVDAGCDASINKYLTNVPDGTYNKVTFRYGISEDIYEQGVEAQGDMLQAAKDAGLFWSWTTGYMFLKYEGSYNGDHHSLFKVHNGSHGSESGHGTHAGVANGVLNETPSRVVNSQLVTIDFSSDTKILVSSGTSPKIHVKVDVAKILNSTNALDVSQGDIIIDAHKSPKVSANVASMFSLAHIHPTDEAFELPDTEDCNSSSNPNEGGDGHEHNH